MTIDEAEKIKQVVENKKNIAESVNTVAKTIVEAFEKIKIEDVNMFQIGYNRALDDIVTIIKVHVGSEWEWDFYFIEQIAEQLKEGKINEYNI